MNNTATVTSRGLLSAMSLAKLDVSAFQTRRQLAHYFDSDLGKFGHQPKEGVLGDLESGQRILCLDRRRSWHITQNSDLTNI